MHTTPGDKYIIFITDGQADYCDDALAVRVRLHRRALQAAYTANIKTIVLGLQTTLFDLPARRSGRVRDRGRRRADRRRP